MSRKQLGVIYRAFKNGQLDGVDKDDISTMYSYVDKINGDYDFARKEGQEVIGYLREAVEAIFNNDFATASSKLRNFKTVQLF